MLYKSQQENKDRYKEAGECLRNRQSTFFAKRKVEPEPESQVLVLGGANRSNSAKRYYPCIGHFNCNNPVVWTQHRCLRSTRFSKLNANGPRTGRPSATKTDESVSKVRCLLAKDRVLRVRMIALEVNISKDTVHHILAEELSTQEICAKMVTKKLSCEQKEIRLPITQQMLDWLTNSVTVHG